MKVFEIRWHDGEKEWIAANTNIEALQKYCSITDMEINDFDDCDEIVELPKSKWKEYTVKEEDSEDPITFKQWMKSCNTPDIIAGTMYEI